MKAFPADRGEKGRTSETMKNTNKKSAKNWNLSLGKYFKKDTNSAT
jgi:hypothetical protein